MKMFLILVLSVTALFVWQHNNAETPRKEQPAPATARRTAASEHDWARHSLDRAHAVAEQVTRAREQSEQP